MANKIMWDKGHGGSDPGACANGLKEKTLVHQIVGYAMDYLENNYNGFEQRTTRTGDQTLTLTERANMANSWGADLFISAHINAGKGTGFETFIFNGKVSDATKSLQNQIHSEILTVMKKFGSITDRGKKSANFAVLRETNMAAVLTENLFIDSNDHNYLKKEEFLKSVGEAHAIGVAEFLKLQSKQKKTVQVQSNVKVEKVTNSDYVGKTLTIKNDGLWFYDTPRWDVCGGVGGKGHTFKITEELMVDGARMVRCHDGKYRTASPTYVDISPKPSDWPFDIKVENITHEEAQKIVNLIQTNFKGVNVYGVPK